MALANYPLTWPDGWKRTTPSQKKNAQFSKSERMYSTVNPQNSYLHKKDLSVMDGIQRVLQALSKMGFTRDDVLISTNIPTRMDGLPRSDQRKPTDPGVAVYWRKGTNRQMRCIAIDIYTEVPDNLAAVAATLEALRAIERHGGAQVQERSFRGFAALPESTSRKWWDVLECLPDSGEEVINAQFRRLARDRHPDQGGDDEAMAELNQARAEALIAIGAAR